MITTTTTTTSTLYGTSGPSGLRAIVPRSEGEDGEYEDEDISVRKHLEGKGKGNEISFPVVFCSSSSPQPRSKQSSSSPVKVIKRSKISHDSSSSNLKINESMQSPIICFTIFTSFLALNSLFSSTSHVNGFLFGRVPRIVISGCKSTRRIRANFP